MIRFVSISAFRAALDALLKVKRGVYDGVTYEICRAFQGASIEQIRANRDMILIDDDSVTIKLRLPDKSRKLSKADGYRLIYMVLKDAPVVVLLTVYPKRGSLQKIDLDRGELGVLLHDFWNEFRNRQIVIHDVYNGLAEIHQLPSK